MSDLKRKGEHLHNSCPIIVQVEFRGKAGAMAAFEASDRNMSEYRSRVLVVDDDPSIRALLQATLRGDYMVFVASDGAEGYEKALSFCPNIAVIDVQMPNWDGLKTLKQFRLSPMLMNVPVIMLTSDASRATVLAALHAGANDYVIKPGFNKAEFLRKIEQHLHKGAVQPGLVGSVPNAAASQKPAVPEPSDGYDARVQTVLDSWD